MTIFLNVTDAISPASHHGITRTERQLAVQLAGRAGVQFVVLRRGRLWCLDTGVVAAHLDTGPSESVPVVERFGVDAPTPSRVAGLSKVRRFVASRADRSRQPELGELTEPTVRTGDALVSVGLDWVHGFLDEAERWVYGAGARYFGFCYDMIPVDHPEWLFPADPVGFMQHFRRVTGVAESVLCISECTRADFIRHFPDYGADRVRTVVLGADAAIGTTPEHDRFAQSLFDGEPYAVYCATIDRRKNHQLLYRVVKEWLAVVCRAMSPSSARSDPVSTTCSTASATIRSWQAGSPMSPTATMPIWRRSTNGRALRVSVVVRRLGSRSHRGARPWHAVHRRHRVVARRGRARGVHRAPPACAPASGWMR